MSPRSIFIIILRVMGLFLLKDMIFSILGIVNSLFAFSPYGREDSIIIRFGLPLLIIGICYALFHVLMFRTGIVVDKLRLDHGFEKHDFSFFEKRTADFDIDFLSLINLALIIVGLYVMVSEIPGLLGNIANYRRGSYDIEGSNNGAAILISAVKVIMGYIMVNAHAPIANFIDKKRKENEPHRD